MAAGATVFAVSTLVLAGSVLHAPFYNEILYFRQRDVVNAYSAALLYSSALACIANLLLSIQISDRGDPSRRLLTFWGLASAGFFVVMLDEYFDLHGVINVLIVHDLLGFHRHPVFTRLDALVPATYGVIAVILIWRARTTLSHIRGFTPFLVVGGLLGLVSVLVDLLTPETTRSIYIEDGAKVYAVGAFLLACLAGLTRTYLRIFYRMSAQRRSRSQHSTQRHGSKRDEKQLHERRTDQP